MKTLNSYRIICLLCLIVPFLAINICLFVYKISSEYKVYPNLDWSKNIVTINSFKKTATSISSTLFCNCLRKWLGWLDSNQRMQGSKPCALPLGDTPIIRLLTVILFQRIDALGNKSRQIVRQCIQHFLGSCFTAEAGKKT